MVPYWLVDPAGWHLREFIHRTGEFTVNIALDRRTRCPHGDRLCAGKDLLYRAIRGQGSFRESARDPPSRAQPETRQTVNVVGRRLGTEALEGLLKREPKRHWETSIK